MRKVLAICIACLAVIIVLVLLHRRTGAPGQPLETGPLASAKSSTESTSATATASANPAAPFGLGPGLEQGTVEMKLPGISLSMPPVSKNLQFTNYPADTVMENMRSVFRTYSSVFNGNPVGTNPEITAALDGGNAKQTKFLREEDGLRVNGKGELVDPWGTPFFFHQLSAMEMEIRSAGPDGVLFTGDDLVTK